MANVRTINIRRTCPPTDPLLREFTGSSVEVDRRKVRYRSVYIAILTGHLDDAIDESHSKAKLNHSHSD